MCVGVDLCLWALLKLCLPRDPWQGGPVSHLITGFGERAAGAACAHEWRQVGTPGEAQTQVTSDQADRLGPCQTPTC